MIDDIIVIDDCISKNWQDDIQAHILGNLDFPWYYCPSITRGDGPNVSHIDDSDGWSHLFWNYELKGAPATSRLTNYFLPLLQECTGQIGFKPKDLLYGRVFQTFPDRKPRQGPPYNILHVDSQIPHLVCLYYVNDSTGPTVVTDCKRPQFNTDTIKDVFPQPKIIKEIEPKKGRVVLFNGDHYHASTNPTEGRRVIINFATT